MLLLLRRGTREGEKVQGIGGQKGSYALYNTGQAVDEMGVVVKMVDEGYDEEVWKHNPKVFEDVEKTDRTE
jgi:hypothetical protein